MSVDFSVLPRRQIDPIADVAEALSAALAAEEDWPRGSDVMILRIARGERENPGPSFELETTYCLKAGGASTSILFTCSSLEADEPVIGLVDGYGGTVLGDERERLLRRLEELGGQYFFASSSGRRAREDRVLIKRLLVALAERCDGAILLKSSCYALGTGLYRPEEVAATAWVEE